MKKKEQHFATETDIKMMNIALNEAKKAFDLNEVPVGAVIYKKDIILAQNHNRREHNNDPCGHAEILVLKEASKKLKSWRLNDCSIAVTLEPCVMCAGALVNARINRLVYGCDDPKSGASRSLFNITHDKRLNHQINVIPEILCRESKKLLQDFFRLRR